MIQYELTIKQACKYSYVDENKNMRAKVQKKTHVIGWWFEKFKVLHITHKDITITQSSHDASNSAHNQFDAKIDTATTINYRNFQIVTWTFWLNIRLIDVKLTRMLVLIGILLWCRHFLRTDYVRTKATFGTCRIVIERQKRAITSPSWFGAIEPHLAN